MKKKVHAQKFAKFQAPKQQKPQQTVKFEPQSGAITIVTHTMQDLKTSQENQAEVLLPEEFHGFKEKDLLVIDMKEPIIVQVTKQSKSTKVENVSILRTLADMSSVEYEPGFKFKGSIRLGKPENCSIQFLELQVKQTFVSRRDQYKIQEHLHRTLVYVGKVLNFEGFKLTVMTLLGNNEIMKKGVIGHNTKIIYRTSCSKQTILLQLSKQTFELDMNQQTYIQKSIQFISALTTRNTMFQNTHRIEIVIFSRLYYPQFKSLNQAYDAVIQFMDELQTSDHKSDKYSLNFAVAFQVDHFGNIYEDVYRKVVWKKSFGNLGSFLWKRIGEFLYTINWRKNVKPFAEFILKRVRQQMDTKPEDSDNSSGSSTKRKKFSNLGDPNYRIRPFQRFLECQLCDSRHCNILQAINLTADQYSKHFYGRSLIESGSAITIISSGHGKFYTDPGTYRLAKSNVYLWNISCVMVCIRMGVDVLAFIKMGGNNDTVIQEPADGMMHHLLYDCLDELIYSSPVNERANYEHNFFQNRMAIRLDNLTQITKENQELFFRNFRLSKLRCNHGQHYVSEGMQVDVESLSSKVKTPQWIEFCNFDQEAFKLHQQLYDKIPEETKFYETSKFINMPRDQKNRVNKIHQVFDKLRESLPNRDFFGRKQETKVQSRIMKSIQRNAGQVFIDNSHNSLGNELFRIQVMKSQDAIERQFSTSFSSKNIGSQHKLSVEFDLLVQPEDLLERSSMSRKGITDNEFQVQNIFEMESYVANKKRPFFAKASHRQHISHYKSRLKMNYKDSKIHSLMLNYKQPIMKLFKTTLHRNEQSTAEAKRIFGMQYFWKLICFPLLTPIKTAYNIQSQNYIQRSTQTNDVENLQEMICDKLSRNFQLVETSQKTNEMIEKSYHLAKGDLYHNIAIHDGVNLNIRECQIIHGKDYSQEADKVILVNQFEKAHSDMFYRYLCYEEKEYRFVGRYTYFKDSNHWKKDDEATKKSFKISFVIDTSNESTPDRQKYRGSCRQNFKQYLQALNETYQGQISGFPIVVNQTGYKEKTETCRVKIVPSKLLNNSLSIYKRDEFFLIYETTWNIRNTFNIEIQWSSCMSVFINDFLKCVLNLAKYNKKIPPFLVPSHSLFDIQWNFESPAEIFFQNGVSIDMLERVMEEQWVWDRSGYYFHKKGFSFVKIYKEKKLLLWKDNTREIIDANESPQGQFYDFFVKVTLCDIIGGVLESVFKQVKL